MGPSVKFVSRINHHGCQYQHVLREAEQDMQANHFHLGRSSQAWFSFLIKKRPRDRPSTKNIVTYLAVQTVSVGVPIFRCVGTSLTDPL